MAYHFHNLVFEGGGVKGIAYLGALQVLEKKGILPQITRVGGTSVGAINALLLALGYTYTEQRIILWEMDFNDFLDDTWIIPNINRVLTRYGWYKGESFRNWISKLIKDKMGTVNATFQDLKEAKKPDLYVYGTNLSTRFSEVFSRELTPTRPIADAVRISMSLPVFFQSISNNRNDIFTDGGLLNNYPIKLFDREKYIDPGNLDTHAVQTVYYNEQNAEFLKEQPSRSPYIYNRETLGFRLDSKQEIAMFRYNEPQVEQIDHFFKYIKALIKTILESQNNSHLHDDDWQRTIYIDTLGVSTTDFDLDNGKKQELEDSGRKCTEAYFEWFDNPTSQPVNRP
jgi:NTE family protein